MLGNWHEDRFDKSEARCHPTLGRTGKYSETPLKMDIDVPDRWVSTNNAHFTQQPRQTKLPNYNMVNIENFRSLDAKQRATGVLPSSAAPDQRYILVIHIYITIHFTISINKLNLNVSCEATSIFYYYHVIFLAVIAGRRQPLLRMVQEEAKGELTRVQLLE